MKKLNRIKTLVVGVLIASLIWINTNAFDSMSIHSKGDYTHHQSNSEANPKAEYSKMCTKISQIDMNHGNPHDVFIEETLLKTLAYVADGWGGLVIFDITKMNKPKVIGRYSNTTEVNAVFVMDKIAYITQWRDGMLVIDVSNPKRPKKIGEFVDSENPWAITGRDNTIFIADGYAGLIILDVSNPSNLVEINRRDVGGWGIYDFHFRDQYLFVVGSHFEIWDISDFTSIKKIGSFSFDSLNFGLHIYKDVALVFGASRGLYCLNITNLTQPTEISYYYDAIYDFMDGYVVDDILYILTEYSGLIILNFSNPLKLKKIDEFRFSGYFLNAYFTNEKFYLADIHGGIRILELGDIPGELHFVGHIVDGGSAFDVYVENSIAYLANGYNGLMIFDVTNPRKPKLLSNHFSGSTYYESIAVENNYAYLLNGFTLELDVYDVSNPNKPIKLSQDSNSHSLYWLRSEIDLEDSKAFAISTGHSMFGDARSFLHVWNTSNTYNITELATISFYSDYMRDIHVRNDTIFLASFRGLLMLDCHNSSDIYEFSSFTSDYNRVYGLAVSGDYAYLSINDFGLKIVDISNMTSPVEVGSFRISEDIYYYGIKRISFDNGYVYLIDEDEGLLIFDVSDVTNPILVGQFYEITQSYWIEDETYGMNLLNLFVKDNLVYLAADLDGFMIVHYDRLPLAPDYRIRNALIGTSSVIGVGLIVGTILLYRRRIKLQISDTS